MISATVLMGVAAMAGRAKQALELAEDERMQLESMVRSRSLPAALTQRAKIVLACAAGAAGAAVARRFETTNTTVGKWRQRFIERRVSGLYDELRPGKPRTISDEQVAELINKTLHTKPKDGATHWSVRSLEAETAISKSSVQRYLKLFAVQPHRT